jgi:hypothetical protein
VSSQLHLWPEEIPAERIRWSVSRDKRLRDCHRKYYYHYYAQSIEDPAAAREIYILKQLHNRFSWVGTVVHELIALSIGRWRRKQEVDIEELIQMGVRKMRAQYAESVQRRYLVHPRAAHGLVEHAYNLPVSKEEWFEQRQKMERCLRHFFAMPWKQTIFELLAHNVLALENLSSFDFAGTTILVKPDFAFRNAQGDVVLVDWKTGKIANEEAILQLSIYAMLARYNRWGTQFKGQVVYLESEQTEAFIIDEHMFDNAIQWLRNSITAMHDLASGEIAPARFLQTDVLAYCTYCSFKKLCGR